MGSEGRKGRLEGKNAIITGAAGYDIISFIAQTFLLPFAPYSSLPCESSLDQIQLRLLFHPLSTNTTNVSGIGLETTILMAREGACVLLADINEEALKKAVDTVRFIVPTASKLEPVKCDVSSEAAVQNMVEQVDSWGGVDIMFNNAGIMHGKDADALDTPEPIWDLTQSINVKGVWFGSKHAILSMRRHKKSRGSIINTASVVALVGSATPQLAYTASKGAVLAMTRELAMVHAKEGQL